MVKSTPIIFIMFGVIILSLSIIGVASFYGEADWTWMSEQIAGMVLLMMVFGVAFFTLFGWLKRK